MSTNRLAGYLKHIAENRPIHLAKFYSIIDSLTLTCGLSSKDIEAKKHKGQMYLITAIPQSLTEDLRRLSTVGGSRVAAARQNRSHAAKVSGSLILVRKGLAIPHVVMIDGEGNYAGNRPQSRTALLIENKQNFIDVCNTLKFLKSHTSFEFYKGMDIILCNGNEITNTLHTKYLSNYECLFLCLDFDLGGLTIADNLMALLPEIQCSFLVPNDIANRLDDVVELQNHSYIDDVIRIGLRNPSLAASSKLIRDKQKVIEQESYLHEYQN